MLSKRLEERVTATVVARLLHVIEPRVAALDRTATDVTGVAGTVAALVARLGALEARVGKLERGGRDGE